MFAEAVFFLCYARSEMGFLKLSGSLRDHSGDSSKSVEKFVGVLYLFIVMCCVSVSLQNGSKRGISLA